MKRFGLALALVAVAIPSYAARQSVTQITGTQASIGALKTQVNTRLDAADDNFIELYAADAAKADVSCFANASAFDACFDLSWVNPAFTSVHATGGNIAANNMQVTKAWQTGLSYTANETSVIHGGKHWIAKTTHTAGSTTEPGVGASYADAWTEVSGSGDDLGDATYSTVVALWASGSCSGYMKSDGSCDTPSGTDDQTAGEVNITDAGLYYTGTTVEAALQEIGLTYALKSNYLALNNTTSFTPDADYEPATKKYVDDAITAGGGYTDEMAQDAVGGMFAGNTETGITVTYDDGTGKVNFAVATQFDGSQNTTGSAGSIGGMVTASGITGALNLTKTGTTARTVTFPDAAGTVALTSDIVAAPTDATITTTDVTTNNASTSKHGWLLKATAPASGLRNVVAIDNGETAYTNKALFDATSPSTQAFADSASVGTAMTAARRDHKHAMPAAPTTITGNAGTATALQTARTIAGASFDGTANINISYNNLTDKPTTEELTASGVATIVGLTGNNKYWGTNGSGTVGVYDSIVIGSGGAQAYDADLTTFAGITPSANVQSLLGAADYAAMRTLLDLEVGTDFNAYDADIADLADGSLTGTKVGFADTDNLWTATNVQAALEEMNDSINAGAPNGTGAKVHWSQLTGVPAGFADGSDDGTGGGITHATSNGTYYASRNGAWSAFTSGNYTLAMTLTGNTAITLPTSGTLLVSGGNIGAATATTPSANDNDTSVATTAYVQTELTGYASDTVTLTNKTYDVAGTGNSFTDFYEVPITIISPADADDPLVDKVNRATTLTGIDCVALGGGTISIDLQECDANGANCASSGATIASCGATNSNDATLTDTSIDSGDWLKLVIGAPSGTVNQVAVKIYGTQVK